MTEIIDNRDGRTLLAQLHTQLEEAKSAHFASGYFFLSGFEPLAAPISGLEEMRLLIGNVSDAKTVEQLAAGFERLELAQKAAQELEFAPLHQQQEQAKSCAAQTAAQLGSLDQTQSGEAFAQTLVSLIESQKLQVRVYTKGRLHAKAYIFDAKNPQSNSYGKAIVGSSNFTLSGIRDNTELNVLVHDNAHTGKPESGNHGALKKWFQELWDDAVPFEAALMEEIKKSWTGDLNSPYEQLEAFLSDGERQMCLLTATPLNSRVWDVYHQLKLFHRAETTQIPLSTPDLKGFFAKVEKGEARLAELTPHVMERRLRKNIIRSYGYSESDGTPIRRLGDDQARPFVSGEKRAYVLVGGRHNFFPKRQLETWTYSIEATYDGLYAALRDTISAPKDGASGALSYARYGLFGYLKAARQKSPQYADLQRAGKSLRGLMRILLFKRFESSVHAFRKTLERLRDSQKLFVKCLGEGFVPAGEAARRFLRQSHRVDEDELLESLADVSKRFDINDFRADDLKADIEADVRLIEQMLEIIAPITPEKDAKLALFLQKINAAPLGGKKLLIFTQYSDTARYLGEQLAKNGVKNLETIDSDQKDKARIVARFAPLANKVLAEKTGEATPIQVLVATDVLSEGLNMQDGDTLINYDLHWNPVRLIQRFGRIDRIGSTHETIYGFNFLPEAGFEKNLGLQAILQARIGEIHAALGEDAAILSPDESLNEAALKTIYGAGKNADLFEIEESDELATLAEAEATLRALRREEPLEWARLNDLRDGIRGGKKSPGSIGHRAVVCRAGNYRGLMLLNQNGEVESRDATKILGFMASERDEATLPLLPGHNEAVMRARRFLARSQNAAPGAKTRGQGIARPGLCAPRTRHHVF